MQSFAIYVGELADRVRPANGKSEMFRAFVDQMTRRMEAGRLEYGDESPTKPLHVLASEVEQEIVDSVNWSQFIAHHGSREISSADREEWKDLAADLVRLYFRFADLRDRLPHPKLNCRFRRSGAVSQPDGFAA
ncbi:MAG TPA: hypothetical protein VMV63_01250 [Acidithiobacillus sp.]|nr:hypothetical protein [Acidithiobacillus sp.]